MFRILIRRLSSKHWIVRHCSESEVKRCCQMLELEDDFNESKLKESYLKLCKKYHPDVSQNPSEKFLQVEEAYRTLRDFLKNRDVDGSEEIEEVEKIKHTVPQHRQYLTYDGVGCGPPNVRLKQYQKYRLSRATENVHEFRVDQIKRQQPGEVSLLDVNLQRQLKPKQGFDRLVEDLIQESMAKGDFENLPGSGKPLKHRPELPYVDSTTYKLNQILINNGFVPEWVRLEKEISEEKEEIGQEIRRRIREKQLTKFIQEINERVKKLNFKIDKYNSLVPIFTKQKIHFILNKEIKRIEQQGVEDIQVEKKCLETNFDRNQDTLISMVIKLFS